MVRTTWIVILACACLVHPALAGSARDGGVLEAHVNNRLDAIRAHLSDDVDFANASRSLTLLLDEVLAYEREALPSRYVELARLRRLTGAFESVEARPTRTTLWRVFEANPSFADALAFAIRAEDDAAGMARVIQQLNASKVRPDALPNLAAAITVVHDQPPEYRPDRKTRLRAEPPATIFEFYAARTRGATLDPRELPVELLVHVVDATARDQEMRWAYQQHRGDQRVGKRYDDIRYDTAFFKYNREKAIAGQPYTLQNIKQHGGVCVDQAYYAAHVGKSIGVPTVTLVAQSASVGHMWVGYLEKAGRRLRWNFEEGRWDDYEHLRGETTDPQTRQTISDGDLMFGACCTEDRLQDRRWAAAHTDAALRLIELATSDEAGAWPPAWPLDGDPAEPLTIAIDDGLEMLEEAVREAPHHAPSWRAIRDLALAGQLDNKARATWSAALMKMAGRSNPDFMMELLGPMVQSVDDLEERASLWKKVGTLCRGRLDLEAESLLAQGRAFAAMPDRRRAWRTFEQVATRYANESPLVVDALRECERLLGRSRATEALTLYDTVFKRIQRPGVMSDEFKRSSNHYRVGSRYATLLTNANRSADAERIRRQIGWVPRP